MMRNTEYPVHHCAGGQRLPSLPLPSARQARTGHCPLAFCARGQFSSLWAQEERPDQTLVPWLTDPGPGGRKLGKE